MRFNIALSEIKEKVYDFLGRNKLKKSIVKFSCM